MHRSLLVSLFALLVHGMLAQRVGIVLSGGGASGMAHIGVLKALEENDIPIDCIAGSSMGALIGGMYSAGLSPQEIDSLFGTEKYELMADGGIEERYIYYFKKDPPDASLITLRFDVDTTLQTSLPTNLRSPLLLDFEQMVSFAGATAVSGGNMDSLFVPFRSVASDITAQRMVVFERGDLAQAIRASMSYPFYFTPISVDGHLMMDGGLYNNFPSDVMYDAFFPDIIIGSNVGYNSLPPSEDDLLSQIRAMLQRPTAYSVICENGIIIEPVTTTSLFDFSTAETTIQEGYDATMARMPEIKAAIARRAPQRDVASDRRVFRSQWPPLLFENIEVQGLTPKQTDFSKKLLTAGRDTLRADELKSGYFRLAADNNIALLHPKALYLAARGTYDLEIQAKREKDLEVRFGGIFSSRAINTGMVGLRYNVFGRSSTQLEATGYFGKFYSSGQLKVRTDLSTRVPMFIEPVFTLHRWDYFRSFANFFDEERPSYVVTGEAFAGLNVGTALGNKGLLVMDLNYGQTRDQYYPDQSFSASDTSDVTEFFCFTGGLMVERNTLNRKQHPNSGEMLKAEIRVVAGDERTTPGSLSISGEETIEARHEWILAKVTLDKYFLQKGFFRLGFLAEGALSTQPFFATFTETVIRNPAFQPTPESRTYFIEEFRAPQYVAGGMRTVFAVARNKLDVRIEGYIFQPYKAILQDEAGRPMEGKELSDRSYLASGSLIYQSPLGPVWFNTSYIDGLNEPWVWSINFGYVIFAKKTM